MTTVSAPLLHRVDRVAAVLGVAIGAAWLAYSGPWAAVSAWVGAVLGVVNFVFLRRITAALVAPSHTARSATQAASTLLLKFAAAGGVVFVMIVWVGLDPRAFAAGLSAVVVSLIVEALRRPDLAGLVEGLGASAPGSDKGN